MKITIIVETSDLSKTSYGKELETYGETKSSTAICSSFERAYDELIALQRYYEKQSKE